MIKYRTAPEARALQFLNKEQTTDKLAPYLFSQCQAIHARSIVPSMDTPSVKATYAAKVSVPTGLSCLMSAIGDEPVVSGEKTVWSYKQNVAIPSYLIAIVVGKLEKRDISQRVAVWAEPSIVDAALWEFEKTEEILKTAESLAGPYVWGRWVESSSLPILPLCFRYDMVVLPASFPFGGMENPCPFLLIFTFQFFPFYLNFISFFRLDIPHADPHCECSPHFPKRPNFRPATARWSMSLPTR